jgi:hypothetical protein
MKQLGLFLKLPLSGLVRGPADDRGLWPFNKGVLSVHALAQSLVGNKDLVRFLNVRMNGIGPALQQWGMGSAKVLAKHSAAWAELLSWRSLASLKTRWRKSNDLPSRLRRDIVTSDNDRSWTKGNWRHRFAEYD